MKKNIWIIISALTVVILATAVFGHTNRGEYDNNEFHTSMQDIMESGNYQDFLDLKEETGFAMMPMIDDEESFLEMQARHSEMHEQHMQMGEGHMQMGSKMHRMNGQGMHEGCPMANQ